MKDQEILKIIDLRLDRLNEVKNVINGNPSLFSMIKVDNQARIDELEGLKVYIKNQKEGYEKI